MGVKQHLMRLQQIGPDDEGPGVAELGMGHLQLGAFMADDRPVLGPVELERFTRIKRKRHECPAPCRL